MLKWHFAGFKCHIELNAINKYKKYLNELTINFENYNVSKTLQNQVCQCMPQNTI